jgi:pimeloyl-ACP methyl ester carboxylesterase
MSTFVLVHGAWHGSWTWDKVAPELRRQGHEVHSPNLPGHGGDPTPIVQVTLQAYADRVTEIIDGCRDPVVLVGHSMGGIVISQAAEQRSRSIRSLVYVCAFLLQDRQSLLQIADKDSDAIVLRNLVMAEDRSSAVLKPEVIREVFYADCSEQDAAWAQSRLVPQAAAPLGTPIQISAAKFGKIPRFYIECLQDRAISPAVQRQMYAASPCKRVFTLDSSHSPFLSKPDELTRALLAIASA